ncbi:MAG: DUF4416 family protein [Candidatus Delongbacteria bacterium]|nr:DUF4416 family protein [Candidatus Delongbacteria bacterium]
MGIIRNPKPVKLVMAIMSGNPEKFSATMEELSRTYGPIDRISPIFPFTHSRYYEREMGLNLQKQFISFENLIAIEMLNSIKITTNSIEIDLSRICNSEDKICRQVNIDPGYISPAKLVLATTKNYDHRIYIGNGIYAEVTLHFTRGQFKAWDWTYQDYQTPLALDFFTQVRQLYFSQLEALGQLKVENCEIETPTTNPDTAPREDIL